MESLYAAGEICNDKKLASEVHVLVSEFLKSSEKTIKELAKFNSIKEEEEMSKYDQSTATNAAKEPQEEFGFASVENMLDLANGLNDTKIGQESPLGKALLKLPTLTELANSQNEIGKALYQNFLAFCKQEKFQDANPVDQVKKDAAYLRFITHKYAEITVVKNDTNSAQDKVNFRASLPDANISLSEWAMILQEVLHDTGTNISFTEFLGKRTEGKVGALAGGLGDNITSGQLFAMLPVLASFNKDDHALRNKLIRADNVEFGEDGIPVFLYKGDEQQKIRIDACTITRETIEELAEGAIARYRLDRAQGKKVTLAGIMQGVFCKDGEELSVEAKAIFEQQQQAIDSESAEIKEFYKQAGELDSKAFQDYLDSDKAAAKLASTKTAKEIAHKYYKDSIEPFFAEFLKTTPEGKALYQDVLGSIASPTAIKCVVTDLTYPKGALSNVVDHSLDNKSKSKPGYALIVAPYVRAILAPKAASYAVSANENGPLRLFVSKIAAIMEGGNEVEKAKIAQLCVEQKGFESFKVPLEKAVKALQLLSEGRFSYSHEAFVQIKDALQQARKLGAIDSQITAAFDKIKSAAGFENGIKKCLETLVLFEIESSGVKLSNAYNIAEDMLGSEGLVNGLLPGLKKQVSPAVEVKLKVSAIKTLPVIEKKPEILAPSFFQNIEQAAKNVTAITKGDKKKYSKPKAYLTYSVGNSVATNLTEYFSYLVGLKMWEAGGEGLIKLEHLEVDKKLLSDPKFFHYFILELSKLEAAAGLPREKKAGFQSEERAEFLKYLEGAAKLSPINLSTHSKFLSSDTDGNVLFSEKEAGVYYSEAQGWRADQEDSFLIAESKLNDDEAISALRKELKKLGENLRTEESGSTAVVSHCSKKQITIANVGDSRGVLYVKDKKGNVTARRLTSDHDLSHPFESLNVKELGGRISYDGNDVRLINNAESPDLNMPRSFGDSDIKGLSSQPDFYQYNIGDLVKDGEEAFLNLGCDGLYERISEEEYAAALTKWFQDEVLQKRYSGNMAMYLGDCAIHSDSTDNITVLMHKVGGEKSVMMAVADGHGGKKVSSAIVDGLTNLTKENGRLIHKATDLDLVGYNQKTKLVPQILKKANLKPHEILGIAENATPKQVINAFKKLYEAIAEGDRKAILPIISKAFLTKFIEVGDKNPSAEIVNVYKDGDDKELRDLFSNAKRNCEDVILKDRAQFVLDGAKDVVSRGDKKLQNCESKFFAGGKENEVLESIKTYKTEALDSSELGTGIFSYVDPNKKIKGETPLVCYLAQHGSAQDLQEFLNLLLKSQFQEPKKNFDINAVDKDGKSALHGAIELGDDIKVLSLLRAGANPNQMLEKDTPLSFALGINTDEASTKKILISLMKYGAKIDDQFREGLAAAIKKSDAAVWNGSDWLEESNDYDLKKIGTAFDHLSLVQQIIARKDKENSPARILGISEEKAGSFVSAIMPWRVLKSYELFEDKISPELAKDAKETVEKGKALKIFSTAFLQQLKTAYEYDKSSAKESVAFPPNNKKNIISLLEHYLSYRDTILSAGKFCDAKTLELVPQISQHLAEAFKDSVKGLKLEGFGLLNVLNLIEKSKETLKQRNKADQINILYHAIGQVSSETIADQLTVEIYSKLMSEIPSNEEFREVRQNLSKVFLSQFEGKAPDQILKFADKNPDILKKEGEKFSPLQKAIESAGKSAVDVIGRTDENYQKIFQTVEHATALQSLSNSAMKPSPSAKGLHGLLYGEKRIDARLLDISSGNNDTIRAVLSSSGVVNLSQKLREGDGTLLDLITEHYKKGIDRAGDLEVLKRIEMMIKKGIEPEKLKDFADSILSIYVQRFVESPHVAPDGQSAPEEDAISKDILGIGAQSKSEEESKANATSAYKNAMSLIESAERLSFSKDLLARARIKVSVAFLDVFSNRQPNPKTNLEAKNEEQKSSLKLAKQYVGKEGIKNLGARQLATNQRVR